MLVTTRWITASCLFDSVSWSALMGRFVPDNLTIFGRATIVVVGLKILSVAVSLSRSTALLRALLLDGAADNTTMTQTATKGTDSHGDTKFFLFFGYFLNFAVLLFTFALYFGVKQGRVGLLRIWYTLTLGVIVMTVVSSVIEPWTNADKNQWLTPEFAFRVFEAWIVSEYIQEVDTQNNQGLIH